MVWGYGETGRSSGSRTAGRRDHRARGEWVVPLLAPEDAVREAHAHCRAGASRPVVIADTQDNPGGGGDSDTTGMLRALVACGAQTPPSA